MALRALASRKRTGRCRRPCDKTAMDTEWGHWQNGCVLKATKETVRAKKIGPYQVEERCHVVGCGGLCVCSTCCKPEMLFTGSDLHESENWCKPRVLN